MANDDTLESDLMMPDRIRLTITIDQETLGWVNRASRRQGISRNEFIPAIRSATERYHGELSDAALRKRRRDARQAMNRLAKQFGNWPAEEILQALRYPWLKSSQRLWPKLRRTK